MTRALRSPLQQTLACGLVAAAVLCCMFSFHIPRAKAAGLTETQIQAVEGLLSSFNVNADTVETVDTILRAPASSVPVAAPTPSPSTSSAGVTPPPSTVPTVPELAPPPASLDEVSAPSQPVGEAQVDDLLDTDVPNLDTLAGLAADLDTDISQPEAAQPSAPAATTAVATVSPAPSAAAGGKQTLALKASVRTGPKPGFTTYLYSSRIATTSNLDGVSGTISLASEHPSQFSEALVSIFASPDKCPKDGEHFPTDPAYTQFKSEYPNAVHLMSFIIKLDHDAQNTVPVNVTLPAGAVLAPCVILALDGGFSAAASHQGYATLGADLTLTYDTNAAPDSPVSLLTVGGEFCFGQTWACQLATVKAGDTVSFLNVVRITKAYDLLALVGNLSNAAFSDPYAAPPDGVWSTDDNFYVYHNCSLANGAQGPGNYYNVVPKDAKSLLNIHQVGRGQVILEQSVNKVFSNVELVPGDCIVHLMRMQGGVRADGHQGGIDAESQVRAVVQPSSSVSLDATPDVVASGSAATLVWAAKNASTCEVTANKQHFATGVRGTKSTGPLTSTSSYAAVCDDGTGGLAVARAVVGVSASADTTAPTAAFGAPRNGQRVSGTVYISVNATDKPGKNQTASGIASVAFSIDGKAAATVSQAPYAYVWQTAAVATGTHSISATVVDLAGNKTDISRSVSVDHLPTPPRLVQLTRFYYPYGPFGDHMDLPSATKPASVTQDYHAEGSLGYISTQPGTGLAPLYACLAGNHKEDVFTSRQQDCEGKKYLALLGYIYTNAGDASDNRSALYRCYRTTDAKFYWGFVTVHLVDHYDTRGTCSEGSREGILGYTSNAPSAAPDIKLNTTPDSVASGSASLITWSAVDAASCSITQSGGSVFAQGTSGTKSTGPLTRDTTYRIDCYRTDGRQVAATTTVSVHPVLSANPTAALSASPTSIVAGKSATLTWSSTGASTCTGAGFAADAARGSATVNPARTTTYSVSCAGSGNAVAKASATVTVTPAAPAKPSITSITVVVACAAAGARACPKNPANTGKVGDTATINGSGFTRTGNTVNFGSGGIQNLTSADGKTISFKIPSSVSAVCPAGRACPTLAQILIPGTYSVSVTNANGTSNKVSFKIVAVAMAAPADALAFMADQAAQSVAAVALAPFTLATDSLTNIFVQLGVGQEPAAVANATSPVLSVSVSEKSSYVLVAGNATGVLLGQYILHATGATVTLTKLGLKLSSGSANDLHQVYLYNGTTIVGTATFTGNNTTATSTLSAPVQVSAGNDITLLVRGDMAGIGIRQPGKAGDLVTVDPNTFEASAAGGSMVRGLGHGHVAGVRLFRSFPSISISDTNCDSATNCQGPAQTLLKFQITANPAGSLGIYRISNTVAVQSASVTALKLYAYADSNYSQPVSTGNPSGQVGTSCILSGGDCFFDTATPIEIPAGATYYFVLHGDVIPASATNVWSVKSTVFGDQTYMPLSPATGGQFSNFVWSPNDTGTILPSDADWTNSFGFSADLAKTLPSELFLKDPASGAIHKAGGTYTIQWTATKDILAANPKVDLVLVSRSGACDPFGCGVAPTKSPFAALVGVEVARAASLAQAMIQSNVSLSAGSLTWVVPSDITQTLPSDKNQYEIYFLKPGTQSPIYPFTDNLFTITPPAVAKTTLTVAPASGTAPLSVMFSLRNPIAADSYVIDYGDNTNAALHPECSVGGGCDFPHTYSTPGTYQAVLRSSLSSCSSGTRLCPPPMVVASASVRVVSNTVSKTSFSVKPASGVAPLSVQFSAANLKITGVYSVIYGDGTSAVICKQDSSGVADCGPTWQGPHTYAKAGRYTAILAWQSSCADGGITCPGYVSAVANAVIAVSAPRTTTPPNTGPRHPVADSGVALISDPGLSDAVAAVAMAPYNALVDSLADLFVAFGVGQ